MRIETNGEVKMFVAESGSGKVQIPLRESIYDIIEDVKKLGPEGWTIIMQDASFEVPPGVNEKNLLYAAMSLVQNAWYGTRSVDGTVPESVMKGHDDRVARYLKSSAKAIVHPPAPDALSQSKTTVKFKSVGPAHIRTYQAAPQGDVALAAQLKGQRRALYDTVLAIAIDQPVSFDALLGEVKSRGLELKGADGGRGAITWHLKELVAAGLVLLSPAQSEIPGTPKAPANFKPDEVNPPVPVTE